LAADSVCYTAIARQLASLREKRRRNACLQPEESFHGVVLSRMGFIQFCLLVSVKGMYRKRQLAQLCCYNITNCYVSSVLFWDFTRRREVSGPPGGPIFKVQVVQEDLLDYLTPEVETDRLSRKVGSKLPFYAA